MRNSFVPILLAGLVALAIGWGVWHFGRVVVDGVNQKNNESHNEQLELPPASANSPLLKRTPGVELRYLNPILKFSFALPDGFTASEQASLAKNTYAVIAVNDSGDGFLVTAEKIKEGTAALTAADIQANAPDEIVSNIQKVKIAGGITGFSFNTNSDLWKGDGRAVWFTHNGYLYRLATYTRDAALLDLLRVTWWFKN